MSREHSLAGGAIERIGFFFIPGLFQGLALWSLFQEGPDSITRGMLALAFFVVVAPSAFFLTVTKERRLEPALFATFLGALMALLAYGAQQWLPDIWAERDTTSSINRFAIGASVFGSAIIGYIMIPFFRTVRERQKPPTDYPTLFEFAWTLPVVAVTASIFTGAVWAVLWLIAGLFGVIGIDFLADLYAKGWFYTALSFGAGALGIGIVRQREGLVLAFRGLLLLLVRALAPVFAVATLVFAVAIIFQGFDSLWDGLSPVGVLSAAMVAGIIFFNGVIDAKGKIASFVLFYSAVAISAVLVIFGALSVYGLWLRVGEVGLTPPRIFGMIFIAILGLYALAYAIAAAFGGRWEIARQANIYIVGLLMVIGVWIQTPFFSPAQWTIASQIERLKLRGNVASEDVAYFAYELGAPGQVALGKLAGLYPDDEDLVEQIAYAQQEDNQYTFARAFSDQEATFSNELQAAIENGIIVLMPSALEVSPGLRNFLMIQKWQYLNRVDRTLVIEMQELPNSLVLAQAQDENLNIVIISTAENSDNYEVALELQTWMKTDGKAAAALDAIAAGGLRLEQVLIPMLTINGAVISPYNQESPAAFRLPNDISADTKFEQIEPSEE